MRTRPWRSSYFPFTGRLLQNKARNLYVHEEHNLIPFWDDDGNELWVRHHFNDRDQSDTREKYVQTLLSRGWVIGARGEVTYIEGEPYKSSTGMQWTKKLTIGGGHLIEAFYDAWRRHPDHPQLRASRHGVPDCTKLDSRSPPAAIKYFTDISNELNGLASRTSFLQMYRKVADISDGYSRDKRRRMK